MKLSVLICIYHKDNPLWLRKALKSLFNQSKKADEIILIIDGDINKLLEEVVEEFKIILPIKVFRNKNNMGLAHSLNKGLLSCKNELVARVDADDIVLPTRFETQVNYMRINPNTVVLGGSIFIIDNDDNIISKRSYPLNCESIKRGMWKNSIAHGTVIYRRSVILKEGAYDPKLRRGQDYELWFRLLFKNYVIENLDTVLCYWRTEPNDFFKSSLSQKLQQVKIGFQGTRRLGLPIWKQLICITPIIPYFLPTFFSRFYMKLKNIIHN